MIRPRTTPSIKVRNTQRGVRINVRSLQELAGKALRFGLELNAGKPTHLSRLSEVFVIIVSDKRMASLHQQFLNQSGPTDVLTFEHGEIVISADTALRNARLFGNSFVRELLLYVVHGLLHLHGFDDRTQADRRKIEAAQEKIITQII